MKSESPAIVNALLRRLAEDSETGVSRSVEDYQTLFPGFEDAVARILETLAERGASEAPEAVGPPGVAGEGTAVLGPYRLIREIGSGGQGIVYLAEDVRLGRRVALKTLRGARFADAAARQRFEREARVASSLDNPGICTVYEVGESDGQAWIAMRYLEGEPLAARLRRHSRPADRAEIEARVRIVEDVARSLHAAHEAGIVHRDLKPGNVILTGDDRPVLVDFGLARGATETLTALSDVLGTPAYMAPERLDPGGAEQAAVPSDVWSLGVVLYESVCGSRPFEGPTGESLVDAIRRRDPVSPRARHPAVSRDLATVILTALAKEPARRYRTAAALAEDLGAVRDRRPISARPEGPLGRTLRWARREPARAALVLALPILATLITIRVKDLGDIAAGRRAQVEAENEETLSEAASTERDPIDAIPLFEKVLGREETSREAAAQAVAGIVLAHLQLAQPDRALRVLDAHENLIGDRTSFRLLRADALRGLGRSPPGEVAVAEESLDHLDHYILGMRAINDPREKESIRLPRALDHANRAIRLSERQRLTYHTLRINVAGFAKERDTMLDSVDTVKALWPEAWSAWSYCAYGLWKLGLRDEAIDACQHALRLRPDDFAAKYYLAKLSRGPLIGEAIAACRKSIRERPDYPLAYFYLGILLKEHEDRLDEAIDAFRAAVRVRPRFAGAWDYLGSSLAENHQLDDAIEAYGKALELTPNSALTYYNLANALSAKNELNAAVDAFHQAIELKPDYAKAHNNLGLALERLGRPEDAVKAYQDAIRWDPEYSLAHNNLGVALTGLKRLDEAITIHEKGTRLKPHAAGAFRGLGDALRAQGRVDDAIEAYQNAIQVKPDFMEAHRDLANALQSVRRYGDALPSVRRWHELRPRDGESSHGSCDCIEKVGVLAAVETHAANGTSPETTAEILATIPLAFERYPAVAARWFREAFEKDPSLLGNLMMGYRFNAARAAVRAAAPAAREEAIAWRNQALRWLESDLDDLGDRRERQRIPEASMESILRKWRSEPDFAPVRDAGIEELPEAERTAWRAFWRHVDGLLESGS